MDKNFTKEEKKLLNAKTPESYIDKSLSSDISPGRKAAITKAWLGNTGYKPEDIKYARNRHPYWKAKKMEGSLERNKARSIEHNYSKGKKIDWDKDLIKEFISMNKKNKKGEYLNKDWSMAQHFKCSIPVIQHMRRKYNMAVKILDTKKEKVTARRLLDLIELGEGTLRKMTKGKLKKRKK